MKKRIIPSILLVSGSGAYLSKNFTPWRSIGSLVQNLKLHVMRNADELLIINIDNNRHNVLANNQRLFTLIRKEVDIPISYVGGINSLSFGKEIIFSGFDKIYITSSFIDTPQLLNDFSLQLGAQSIGISLPYIYNTDYDDWYYWDYNTKTTTQIRLHDLIVKAIKLGAGEIILSSVLKDGTLSGYDLNVHDLLKTINPDIPILLSGGCGSPKHVLDALSLKYVHGVVGGSVFELTEFTPKVIRSYCKEKHIAMRSIKFT